MELKKRESMKRSYGLTVGSFAVALVIFLQAFGGNHVVLEQQKNVKKQVTTEATLDQVRATLKSAKRALAREGKYSCCIMPSCDSCALSVGQCPCNENLSNDDPVCHECKGGWVAGLGAIEGVKPEEVKTPPTEMTKMMYETRAKKYLKRK